MLLELKNFLEKQWSALNNFRRQKIVFQYFKNGRILDVGCSTGEFLTQFKGNNWERYGIEPNKTDWQIAKKKGGLKVYQKQLLDCHFPRKFFEVITLWHVLEHLYNPKETMIEIKRILKNDGLLILSTPNTSGLGYKIAGKNWFHYDARHHCYLYNLTSLTTLLKKTGFKIIKINYPFLEYLLDLFHSIMKSKVRHKQLKLVLAVPLIFLLLTLRPLFSLLKLTETIEVICIKN